MEYGVIIAVIFMITIGIYASEKSKKRKYSNQRGDKSGVYI